MKSPRDSTHCLKALLSSGRGVICFKLFIESKYLYDYLFVLTGLQGLFKSQELTLCRLPNIQAKLSYRKRVQLLLESACSYLTRQ